MRKIRQGLLLICLYISPALAFNAPVSGVQTPVAQTIRIGANQPDFSVTLSSNPTTGYQWFLQHYNPQLLMLIEHHVVPPNTQLIGAPSQEVWRFHAQPLAFQTPQMIPLQFVYKRPWEKNTGQQMIVIVGTVPRVP